MTLTRSAETYSRHDLNGFRPAYSKAFVTAKTFFPDFGFHLPVSCSPKDSILADSQAFIAAHAPQGLNASSE